MIRRRPDRVGELLKEEVSRILSGELKDPLLGFITITGVKVSGDLRHAKIFVSVLGDEEERKKSLQGLDRAKGYIRRLLGKRLKLRFTPDISFQIDKSAVATPTEGMDGGGS